MIRPLNGFCMPQRFFDDLFLSFQATYESQQDIQLMRFADFFARSFASVSASQFPWAKMFKESPVAKIADVSLFCLCLVNFLPSISPFQENHTAIS